MSTANQKARTQPMTGKVPPQLATPTELASADVAAIAKALNGLIADAFALYVKTKNFHWHLAGIHFRDLHLLFDEQAEAIFAMIDPLAERVRRIGGTTIRSIGHVAQLQSIPDDDEVYVTPREMVLHLMRDNQTMIQALRAAHEICDESRDIATASIIENLVDEAERRTWFLFEVSQGF